MKQKIWSILLIVAMILPLTAGLSGCGKSGFGSTLIVGDKGGVIGDLKKDGWTVSIPAGAFEQDVKVTVDKVADSTEACINGKAAFLTTPIEIKAEGTESVRLDEPARISMKLDEKNLPDNSTFDQYVMSYWTGDEWEVIIPDPVELSKGYLTFETWHFSSYSGKKMTDDEQVREYARDLAIDDLTNQARNEALKEKLTAVVDDYLNGLSIYDQEARNEIISRVWASSSMDIAVFLTENGASTAELGYKVTDMIVESTVDVCAENPLILEAVSTALDSVGDAAEASVALYDGNYRKAASELTALGATVLGYGGVGAVKSLVDLGAAAVEQGIMAWKDYEEECAYKVFYGLAKGNAYGYKINAGDWETLITQMGGYYHQIVRERKDEYKRISGKDTLSDDEQRMIERQVESDLKKKFEERAKIDSKIDAKQAEYEILVKAFKDAGLLTRTENGFKEDMTVNRRMHSLLAIRGNILNIVGGDISKFGREKDREENLAYAIKMWIGYGKDRAKFYDWMREMGYLEKQKEGTGYWKLVRSFTNKYETSASDEYYSSTWSGGSGSYAYNCKVTHDSTYWASTHDNCNGEFVNNTGTSSIPNSRYAGGEQAQLTLTVSAATSSNICFHLGAHLTSCITPVNHDDPFVNYGTNMYMQNIDDESARGDVRTYKNDTNTGYIGGSVTSGVAMPMGYEDGDKVYILIIFTGGNNEIKTAYEYEWVKK